VNRAIDAYLAELEARRYSHSRRHHAARTLERLLIYMREAHSITDWRAVHESQLRDFALYAATRHRSPGGKRISAATLHQWLSIVRSFFVWLNRTGRVLHNPAERLTFPHKEQSLPRVLNESEIARLIETPDITTTIGLRDRALLEVLYATGIRHAEAHKLDLYDVETAAHRLTVRLGKGQRDRVVPLTETAAQWLTRYVTAARPELAAGKWWGKGKRRGQPKLIPPNRGALALSHWPSSLVSNDCRPHPRLRFASRSEGLSTYLSPLVRDSFVARRRQCPSRATTAWPPGPQHDGNLHAY
jgi:site-specific recombinase XerD